MVVTNNGSPSMRIKSGLYSSIESIIVSPLLLTGIIPIEEMSFRFSTFLKSKLYDFLSSYP